MKQVNKRFKSIPVGLSVATVMVAGLVAWTVIVAWQARQQEDGRGADTLKPAPPPDPPITSLIGTVDAIEEHALLVKALPSRNAVIQAERVFKIGVNDDTVFMVTEIPKEIPADAKDIATFFRSSMAERKSLKVGDEVNVRMGKEIDPSEDLFAKSVEIMKVK